MIDKVVKVSDDDAFNFAKLLAKTEGILVGISSGATLAGTIQLLKNDDFKDKNVVMIFADGYEKYLSTQLF